MVVSKPDGGQDTAQYCTRDIRMQDGGVSSTAVSPITKEHVTSLRKQPRSKASKVEGCVYSNANVTYLQQCQCHISTAMPIPHIYSNANATYLLQPYLSAFAVTFAAVDDRSRAKTSNSSCATSSNTKQTLLLTLTTVPLRPEYAPLVTVT